MCWRSPSGACLRPLQAVTVCRPDGRAYDFQFDAVLHHATQQATYEVRRYGTHSCSGGGARAQRVRRPARVCRRARVTWLRRPCRGTAAPSSAMARQASPQQITKLLSELSGAAAALPPSGCSSCAGSGKTFTMLGAPGSSEARQHGLAAQVLHEVSYRKLARQT